ncbi:MAG: T9SS type A sorting domain-containing protein [Flavobacteriales bacterium]
MEQSTYHEWLNSDFNNKEHPESGITCQGCHMPLLNDDMGVVLSANYIFLQPKTPFGLHHFAGANTFMLEMLKNNGDELGVSATATQFDSTIARTKALLQRHSLLLEAAMRGRDEDTAFVEVKLTNIAGHKFPSGYPARRAWVELVMTDDGGDTLFHSGGWNGRYEVIGHDAQWEPHYDMVRTADQVQIYEMVMGDVNGNKTTVLERASYKLKDNRLPPSGFTAAHYSYDTAYVANVLPSDVDFNRDAGGQEGSGTDIVHYHVPMHGSTGTVHVSARVWYQSVPPKWMEEMFSHTSVEIDRFRTLYDAADNTPVLVCETSFMDVSTGVDGLAELGLRLFPNPVQSGPLVVLGADARVTAVTVFDLGGRRIGGIRGRVPARWSMELPVAGTYLVVVEAGGRRFTQRIVRL